MSQSEKKEYSDLFLSTATGYNTFSLFMERALDSVNPGGEIHFLVPEAFLNIKTHQAIRDIILKRSDIISVSTWGNPFRAVFSPAVSVHYRAVDPGTSGSIRVFNNRHRNSSSYTLVPREKFMNPEGIYNIHYRSGTVTLVSAMETGDTFTLRDRGRFYLGIVTGNNTVYISRKQNSEYPDPILTGNDISPYRIAEPSLFFKFDPASLQQTASRDAYNSKNKILYRFIGKQLTFALDRYGKYSLNNVNGFIPEIGDYWNETLVALFNSRIMRYYYEQRYFTLKVLRGNLENLPVKRFSLQARKQIRKLHDAASEGTDEERAVAVDHIEQILLREYGICEKTYEHEITKAINAQFRVLNQHSA